MPTILPIFDIDGTLTHTTGVDDEAFVHAVQRVLGCDVRERDWGKYRHSTDEGLTLEIAERELGRAPTPDEYDAVRAVFFAGLEERIGQSPERCRPAPGVVALLSAMRALAAQSGASQGDGSAKADHAPEFRGFAIASGAWPGSAQIKLRASGLDVTDIPYCFSMAHADRRPLMREEIITTAARRFVEQQQAQHSNADTDLSIVYIGDGVWDARAAKALGIGFLGVRLDSRTDRLRAEAPDAPIITNYLDTASVLSMIPALAKPFRV